MTTAPRKAEAKSVKRPSDPQLIEECLKGKESAWNELIDRYKNLIFSIPVHYGFSEEDSSDIFQAVCMDLLAELPRFREPQALAGWLIQVARNKCFHRKQSLRRCPVQEIDDVELPAQNGKPDELVCQIEQEALLRQAVAELSPQCQQLIDMLFFEIPPRSYQQVAKQLDLAQGSIGFTRRSCLDKLRERLERIGY